MPTLHILFCAELASVGVSQCAAASIGILLNKGGLTTQWIDNKVREHVCEIAQSTSIITKQGAGPDQWNPLIDHCVTSNSNLESKYPLCKRYMPNETNLDGQKLKAALDKFADIGFLQRKNQLEETLTKKSKLMHVGMNFIAPMLLLLVLMMCRSRWGQGTNRG
jgi:hypothetical protein